MKHLLQFVIVVSVFCLAACKGTSEVSPVARTIEDVHDNTWVAMEPIQCLGNPWELDWLANHQGDYSAYPKDLSQPGLEPEEFAIIKDYYQRQGVVVSAGQTAAKYDEVCAACTCPEGYTLYLSVREQDIPTMLSLGYRLESPK